jgi:hypothetical protein
MSIASFWTPETQPCEHVHLGKEHAERQEPREGATVRIVRIVCIADEPRGINSLGELRLRAIEGRCGRWKPGSQRDRPRELAEIR